jgi:hypothetical protein
MKCCVGAPCPRHWKALFEQTAAQHRAEAERRAAEAEAKHLEEQQERQRLESERLEWRQVRRFGRCTAFSQG